MALSASARSVFLAIAAAAEEATTFERAFQSEAIRGIRYNPITGELGIMFTGNNTTYLFFDVPRTLVARFVASPSKGSFYWSEIEGRFQS